jgi:quinol-cytochrome oxidoreductase complex cytochrome b subunit
MEIKSPSTLEKITGNRIWRSVFRHGYPDNDLDRMATMFTNFFLHILPAKVHKNSLRLTYTWGLGVIAGSLLFILTVTGLLLMFFYVPSVERAYNDMKDLQYVVSYGVILRNMHRWAAHGMVVAVLLHMVRVFYTGSYKPPREFNWVLGVVLWVTTLLFSFTGYLLPWDQLAFWAITVGTSIAGYPPWIGEKIHHLLLGGSSVGQGALLRFYVLHVVFLPMVVLILLSIHFWRVRKDGGLSRPRLETDGEDSDPAIFPRGTSKTYTLVELVRGRTPMVESQAPEEGLVSWPHLVFRILLLFQFTLIVVTALSFFFDAPLKEMANPARPENPARAPWYFLGVQELVSYSALTGGVIVPTIAILGLISIPYLDNDRKGEGIWFTSGAGKLAALVSFVSTALVIPALIYLNLRAGVRAINPDAPQPLVDLINPASVLTQGIP